MTLLVLAIGFTLGVSAFCSLLEAFILSTTVAEIESLKRRHPRLGEMLEHFKHSLDETSSAILTLNTVANTLGSVVVGALASSVFGNDWRVGVLTGALVLGILLFSEILPKNIGVRYRRPLQPYLVVPLRVVRWCMYPLSSLAKGVVRLVLPRPSEAPEHGADDILLLAEKQAQDGTLSAEERNLIANALSLEETAVGDLMTPRTVMSALDESRTVGDIFRELQHNIPFARMPVYRDDIDHIVGIVRRRDLLAAYASDQESKTVRELMGEAIFVPASASAADALKQFLAKHMQLAIAVDEYGSTAGVITMEDLVEHLLGTEIYEQTDVAVDMRDLARRKAQKARADRRR